MGQVWRLPPDRVYPLNCPKKNGPCGRLGRKGTGWTPSRCLVGVLLGPPKSGANKSWESIIRAFFKLKICTFVHNFVSNTFVEFRLSLTLLLPWGARPPSPRSKRKQLCPLIAPDSIRHGWSTFRSRPVPLALQREHGAAALQPNVSYPPDRAGARMAWTGLRAFVDCVIQQPNGHSLPLSRAAQLYPRPPRRPWPGTALTIWSRSPSAGTERAQRCAPSKPWNKEGG